MRVRVVHQALAGDTARLAGNVDCGACLLSATSRPDHVLARGKLERNPIGDLRHLIRGRSAPVDAEDRVMSSAGATTNSRPTNVGVLLMWR